MRVSLKAKLTALISLLVLLVVVTVSGLYLWGLVRQALGNASTRGADLAQQVYDEARAVLAASRLPAGFNVQDPEQLHSFLQSELEGDAGLNSAIQNDVADVPSIDYIAITDSQPRSLVHSDPSQSGQPFSPAPPFSELLRARFFRQLQIIYGRPQVYEVVLPLQFGGPSPASATTISLDVRVGLSTVLLGYSVKPELWSALRGSLLIMVLATLFSGILSFRLLRPLETISRSVDRIARGESSGLQINRKDEWGILSSKLNLLGEQVRGEKAAFVALKENLGQLFSNLADGLLLFDHQDRLVLATPAVERFLGHAPDGLLHQPASDVFAGEGALDHLLAEGFRKGKSIPWRTLDLGEHVPAPRVARVAVSAVFIEEQGKRVASLVTLRDASIRAQIEDQIDVTAKLAALGRLTSGVAHEVRNPLNSMVLQVELLKTKLEGEGGTAEPHLEILSGEIRRLDRVVKTFLDFTRPVEIHPVETSIEELIGEVFRLAETDARQQRVELAFESNGPLPRLPLDRDLMKQALLNLVLNGCQAMPSGGRLCVSPRVSANAVEIDVADQGVGIPSEARQKIFSLYYTTKPKGTGVGLAMTFRIIQLHQGTIEFTSEPNLGTTFRIFLPRGGTNAGSWGSGGRTS
ncbi:MAG TPA: ATP-binding protein [Terriglobia bacterium]|nr:ATP-binding protein [Terriglobia bacterium]